MGFIASSNTCCWCYARHSNIFRDTPHTADRGEKNKAHGLFSNCLSKQFFRGYLSKFQNNFPNIIGKDFFFNGLDRKKTRRERKTSFTFICAYIKFLKEKTQKDLTSKLPKALSHMAYISLKEIDSSSRGQWENSTQAACSAESKQPLTCEAVLPRWSTVTVQKRA